LSSLSFTQAVVQHVRLLAGGAVTWLRPEPRNSNSHSHGSSNTPSLWPPGTSRFAAASLSLLAARCWLPGDALFCVCLGGWGDCYDRMPSPLARQYFAHHAYLLSSAAPSATAPSPPFPPPYLLQRDRRHHLQVCCCQQLLAAVSHVAMHNPVRGQTPLHT
jgi:hypothetical protein